MVATKFRVWHKEKKVMFFVKSIIFEYKDTDSWAIETLSGKIYRQSEVILMQFTTLKDISNPPKEIYQGDIIRAYVPINKEIVEFQIKWESNLQWWAMRIGTPAIIDSTKIWHFPLIALEHKNPKVIGNVYEHPELLNTKPRNDENSK